MYQTLTKLSLLKKIVDIDTFANLKDVISNKTAS